jgi:hypothetical protein
MSQNHTVGKSASDYGLDIKVVEITPDLAESWLKLNLNNRRLRESAIAKYRKDMASGDWAFTGEAIVFSGDGVLINGQNRLTACQREGASFVSLVIWGVDSLAFRAMDKGVPRGTGDMFGIDKMKNPDALAALVRQIWRSLNTDSWIGGGSSSTPTDAELRSLLESLSEDSLQEVIRTIKGFRTRELSELGLRPAIAGCLYWTLAQIDPVDALYFINGLITGFDDQGLGLPRVSAISVVREQIKNNLDPRNTNRQHPLMSRLSYILQAWNAFRDDDTSRKKFSVVADFPTPR